MHKSQNVFLPKENSVKDIQQNLRMGSIQTVNSSVTVSLFVRVTFYCVMYREYNMVACGEMEPVRNINKKR